jgi:Ca2+-binding EF-hand superfamily protein
MKKLALAAAAALALAAGSAFAADDKKDANFNTMDKDNDGYLSRTEAAGNKDLMKKWKEADRNNDGKVSRAEYLMVMGKQDVKSATNKVEKSLQGKEDKAKAESSAGATK